MRKHDVFEIITKVFGLYCIVQFIRSAPAVFAAIAVNQPEFVTNVALYIVTISLYPLVFLVLSVIFIFKSDLITQFLCPELGSKVAFDDHIETERPAYGKLPFWITIIGIYYLISSTASVLSGLPTIFIKMKEGWILTHDPFIPQTLILIMSLACIFKSEKIEEIINKLKHKKT
jgi:hypothetical protein